jgi:Flp pilus assembly protein TadD
MTRALSVLACGLVTAALLGCESIRDPSWTADTEITGSTTPEIQHSDDVRYYPSDEAVRLGREYFNRGNYGNAERSFREAVEKAPEDLAAWIGLAASYDRLSRFDLADRAYAQAVRLGGETPQILNNIGYSYMLRGDLVRARAKFNEALQRAPQNATVLNNIELLNASRRFIERSPQTAD